MPTRYAARWRRRGDTVIATATEEAPKGSNTVIDYAASRAALITLTKSVATHLAQRGVRANVVAPGPTWTPLNEADRNMPPDGLAHIDSEAPLARAAQPEEIAPTYVYLASDADSSYTVGEVIAVTGGIVDTRVTAGISGPGSGPCRSGTPSCRWTPAPTRRGRRTAERTGRRDGQSLRGLPRCRRSPAAERSGRRT